MILKVRQEDYLPSQWLFLTAPQQIKGFIGGMGSGKTYAFVRQTFINHVSLFNKDGFSNGWVIYPTFDLAEEIFVEPFNDLLDSKNIPYNYNKTKHRYESAYGKIRVYQLQHPQRIVGSNLTYIGFDEFDIESYKNCDVAYRKAIGRMRGSEKVMVYIVTTPEGIKYTYKIFVTDNKNGERYLVHAKSTDNKYLPDNYLDLMAQNFHPKLLAAYRDGEFVNLSEGQLYYAFGANSYGSYPEDRDRPLYLTCDFNKSPMVWEVIQVFNNALGIKCIKRVAEIATKNEAKTQQNARKFIDRFNGQKNRTVYLTGDSSGNVESHKDFTTDYVIIKEELSLAKFNVIPEIPKHNPNVSNRINIVNSLLYHERIFINNLGGDDDFLKADFENNVSDQHGAKDKTDPWQTHGSDAFDYLVWLLFKNEFFENA